MTVLQVVLAGAGRAGANHALHLAEHVPAASIAGVVDADADSARALAESARLRRRTPDLEEAIERTPFDAVVIATPTFTHRDLAVTAAAAGKHVFCEKPMAITERECDEMAEAAERAGVVLQIGFMRRFQPEFVEARRRIEAGEIGDPMVIKSLTRGPGLPPPWAWDLKTSNGMLAEVNSHDFDCVRWLMGSEITRVYAEAANVKGARPRRRRRGLLRQRRRDAAVRLRRRSGRSTGRARPTTATTRASRSSARRACCRSARSAGRRC